METADTVVNEVVNPSPAPETSTPHPAPAQAPAPEPSEQGSEEKAAAAAIDNAYKPNYKVKAYDNEYEIPEKFRAYINKENEKDFRETFERTFALDEMKNKYHKTRDTYQTIQKEYSTLQSNINQLSKYVENGDFDSFFKGIEIPEEALQKWMLQKLQMKDLPPEQQQVYNNQQELRQKAYQLEMENQRLLAEHTELKSSQEQQLISQRYSELDQTISKPEVEAVAKNFDSRLGQPGAFKQEVINRAAFVYQTTGKDLSVDEAVKEVLKIVAWNTNGASSDAVVTQQGQQQAPKPTLPNVAGKATSPAAQKVKSIDDLKKLRNQTIKSESLGY